MDIVKYAESKDMGYFSINHAVDRCPVCNYVGVIDDACPRCGFSEEAGVDLEKLKELQKYYPDITIPNIKLKFRYVFFNLKLLMYLIIIECEINHTFRSFIYAYSSYF